MYKTRLILAMAAVLLFPAFIFADTIVLKSGKTIDGKLVKVTNEAATINIEGAVITYYLDEIVSVDGKKLLLKEETQTAPAAGFLEKSAEEIFEECSPAVALIIKTRNDEDREIGSGFIVDKDGTIVTNYHVMAEAKKVEVKLKDGRVFPVDNIISYDVVRDICVFKIEAKDLSIIALADPDRIKTGQKILAIGNPRGLEYSISDGIVSAVREDLGLRWIQFTAPASQGSSGGPLLNLKGQAVGIVTQLARPDGQNLNYAIPIKDAVPFIRKSSRIKFSEFSNPNRDQMESLYYKGHQAFIIKDYRTAINFLERTAADPRLAYASSSLLGLSYQSIENYGQSIEYFQKAIAINQNNPRDYSGLAISFFRTDSLDNAIFCFEKEISLESALDNPSHVAMTDAYLLLGLSYRLTKQYEKGISMSEKAIPYIMECQRNNYKAPDCCIAQRSLAMAYSNLGNCYSLLGNKAKAREFSVKLRDLGEAELAQELDSKN